jgi:tripartite ATP-independent transporter DctM subunit
MIFANYEWLGLVMFACTILFLASGYPVSFSLGGVAIVFGIIGISLDLFSINLLNALPNRIFGTMSNFVLLAIPYFVFMGAMLEQSGLAEDLLETMGMLFGPMRGGLGIAVVFVGTLLAATTGVVAATVVAMTLISLPVMLRYGYNKGLAAGAICASGTLGQIIPPSLVLVVLGSQLGVSLGDLFIGSLLPGVMLSSAFALYVGVVSFLKPEIAPALPPEVRTYHGWQLAKRVLLVMIPPFVLILAVLGSIFFGIASATEAGAVGALGATLLALISGKLDWGVLRRVSDSTLRVTTMVIFILIGSTAFSLVLRGIGGDKLVEDIFTSLPGGQWGFLIFSMLLVFVLGFFIDFFEIAFIVIPLLVPAADALGINAANEQGMTLVWYGVILGANLQTSFLTPPFGFSLFFLRGVAPPEVRLEDVYRGVIPFIIIQVTILILIVRFPILVNYLIDLM